MKRQAKLQTRLKCHLGEIARCRRCILAGTDPEGVHDLRVAIRGLRVMLLALGPHLGSLRQDWRNLAQDTSQCRDLEVLLALIDMQPAPPEDIREQIATRELAARVKLASRLSQADIPSLIQHSRSTLGKEKHLFCPARLRRRTVKLALRFWGMIQAHISTLTPQAPAECWHHVRLDVKRLRYLLEYCNDMLPEVWLHLLPPLRHCQSTLGDLHDIDLLIEISPYSLIEERQHKLSTAQAAIDSLMATAARLILK